jgi:hypothetical protein
MDGDTSKPLSKLPTKPLTTEQAKARLRAAADQASPTAWFQRHPLNALGIAVAGGFIISRVRLPVAAGVLAIEWLGPLLLGVAMRQLGSPGNVRRKTRPARHRKGTGGS